MVMAVCAESGVSMVGCSAKHRMMAPLSALDTGRVSREMDIHVLASGEMRLFSWVWPVMTSRLPAYHLTLAGGLPPETMHSSSSSSPAEAMISWPSSPTR